MSKPQKIFQPLNQPQDSLIWPKKAQIDPNNHKIKKSKTKNQTKLKLLHYMRKLQKHIISCNISLLQLQSTSTSINLNANQPQLQSTSTSINLIFNQPQLNMAVTPKQPNLV